MRYVIQLLTCLIVINGCYAVSIQQDKPVDPITREGKVHLTVLSYNIHHSNPPSKPDVIDLNAIVEVIKESNADVVGLQEVDVYTERSGRDLHMAKELASRAGYPFVHFSKAIDFQEGAYGTAILSKFPISDTLTLKLPNPEDAEPRTLSLATIGINDSIKIRFANTHLDYSSAVNNMAQVEDMKKYLEEEDLPVLVTGDFNAIPERESIQFFLETFYSSCGNDCEFTSPADHPKRTIDYIFYNRPGRIGILDHQVLQFSYPSDHLPLKARFELK